MAGALSFSGQCRASGALFNPRAGDSMQLRRRITMNRLLAITLFGLFAAGANGGAVPEAHRLCSALEASLQPRLDASGLSSHCSLHSGQREIIWTVPPFTFSIEDGQAAGVCRLARRLASLPSEKGALRGWRFALYSSFNPHKPLAECIL